MFVFPTLDIILFRNVRWGLGSISVLLLDCGLAQAPTFMRSVWGRVYAVLPMNIDAVFATKMVVTRQQSVGRL